MELASVTLTNFKNYQNEHFEFSPKYNAIVGNNGMGKTNLLDAVYFTCMTKSNFIKLDKSLVNKSAKFLRTEALMRVGERTDKIVCKFDTSKKKIFEVNGKILEKLSDHIGNYPVVFIVPGDQILISDGSKERRKLLDNTLSQLDKGYLTNLFQYNALLNQRNAYLKSHAKSGAFSKTLVMAYTEKMVRCAEYIFEKRKTFTLRFAEIFTAKYSSISGSKEKASCYYKSQLLSNGFLEGSEDSFSRDKILGRTSFGIHKDDLIFQMDGGSVKYFASQGQTKSFILSIKLAQFALISEKLGMQPILLLDDIFDKLDQSRVNNFIQLLEAEKVNQVFISDTDEYRIVSILEKMNVPFKKFVIQDGHQKRITHDAEEE